MLEQQGLLLCPWQWDRISTNGSNFISKSDPNGNKVQACRQIVDLTTREPLGIIRCRTIESWTIFRWLHRQVWDVLETEDESHLMSLYAPWAFVKPWEVHDAENKYVCMIHSGVIFNRNGIPQARLANSSSPIHRTFQSSDRENLATCQMTFEGTELTFSPTVEDPFIRMALLGATLAMGMNKEIEKAS